MARKQYPCCKWWDLFGDSIPSSGSSVKSCLAVGSGGPSGLGRHPGGLERPREGDDPGPSWRREWGGMRCEEAT